MFNFNFDMQSRYLGLNTDRGLSPILWTKLLHDFRDGNLGIIDGDDFLRCPPIVTSSAQTGPWDKYEIYAYAGSTLVDGAVQGGAVAITDVTDNEGVAIGPVACPYQLKSSLKRLVFEARLKVSTIADTKFGMFCGLLGSAQVAVGVPLATDGTIADSDCIGFHRLEGDGDMLDIVWKAAGQTQVNLLTDAITLVADTFIKVGFVFDPTEEAAKRLKFYYNGTLITTYGTKTQMDAATFPSTVTLGFALAQMAAVATPGSTTIDWWACGQQI